MAYFHLAVESARTGAHLQRLHADNGWGDVWRDLRDSMGKFRLRWLDIENNRWTDVKMVSGGDELNLSPPRPGHWVVMLDK